MIMINRYNCYMKVNFIKKVLHLFSREDKTKQILSRKCLIEEKNFVSHVIIQERNCHWNCNYKRQLITGPIVKEAAIRSFHQVEKSTSNIYNNYVFQHKRFLTSSKKTITNSILETMSTPNENALKFMFKYHLPNLKGPINITRNSFINDNNENSDSNSKLQRKFPFLKRMFVGINEISSIYISDGFMTIVKQDDMIEWQDDIEKVVCDLFNQHQASEYEEDEGSNDDSNNNYKRSTLEGNDEIENQIIQLLEERARPYAQADGGDILFESFDKKTGIVYVSMMGACAGCSSSTITLKFMIKNLLCHFFLDVVKDVKSIDEDDDDDDDDNSSGNKKGADWIG